jgi:hypothetical protein
MVSRLLSGSGQTLAFRYPACTSLCRSLVVCPSPPFPPHQDLLLDDTEERGTTLFLNAEFEDWDNSSPVNNMVCSHTLVTW